MQSGDLAHVEFEPIDVLIQVHRERIRRCGRRRIGGSRCVRIDFDQDLRGRQIHHGERVVVAAALNWIDLDCPLPVGQRVFVGECLEDRRFLRLFESIGNERVRGTPRLLVIGPVHLVRHDRGSLVHVGAQAARVIEVGVRVHEVLDRLVRDCFLDFGDDGE